jgi:hypothetical protein
MFGCKENGAALEATRFFVSFDVYFYDFSIRF